MQSKALITIDTEVRNEGRHLVDAYERYVEGTNEPNNRAAHWISQTLRDAGFPGVFFLDVYGTAEFPNANYPELCERLLSQGHTVELHTHPDRMYDRARLNMHEYSLNDQIQIVGKGIDLIEQWTGRRPIAHRAGRYGANVDTIAAIKHHNIRLDSSFFYGRDNCKLPYSMTNLPFEADGVLEIPVTTSPIPIAKLGRELPFWTRRFWKRYQKLDVNSMDSSRLCRAIREVNGTVPYIVLFLHSFSFSRRHGSKFEVDQPAVDAYLAMLQLLQNESIPVVTFDEVRRDPSVDAFKGATVSA